jgi:hypothetical protein
MYRTHLVVNVPNIAPVHEGPRLAAIELPKHQDEDRRRNGDGQQKVIVLGVRGRHKQQRRRPLLLVGLLGAEPVLIGVRKGFGRRKGILLVEAGRLAPSEAAVGGRPPQAATSVKVVVGVVGAVAIEPRRRPCQPISLAFVRKAPAPVQARGAVRVAPKVRRRHGRGPGSCAVKSPLCGCSQRSSSAFSCVGDSGRAKDCPANVMRKEIE